MVSCMLVFSRLSADGEITAMKSSGVSLAMVSRSTFAFAALLVILSLLSNHWLEPRGHFARRSTIADMGAMVPLKMLQEGRFNELGDVVIYVGDKSHNVLHDIRIFDRRPNSVVKEVRARKGIVIDDDGEGEGIVLELHDVWMGPVVKGVDGRAHVGKWRIRLDMLRRRRKYKADEGDFGFFELRRRIANVAKEYPHLAGEDLVAQKMILSLELTRRSVMAAACFVFVLIGIPLGVRSHRRSSSSKGVGLGLALIFVFYLLTALADSLVKHPHLRPDLVMWAPVILFAVTGLLLFRKAN